MGLGFGPLGDLPLGDPGAPGNLTVVPLAPASYTFAASGLGLGTLAALDPDQASLYKVLARNVLDHPPPAATYATPLRRATLAVG